MIRRRRQKLGKSNAPRYAVNLISPKVISEFLHRPRDSWQHLKELPRKKLESLVYPQFDDFHTEPWTHQLVCQLLGMAFPQFEWLLDMGLGKSGLILNLIVYHMLNSGLTSTLILAPSAVNVETWSEQIATHQPDLRAIKLLGTQEERFNILEEPADVYLMNYAGLAVYMAELEERKKKEKGKTVTVNKMTPNRRLVENFLNRFNGVVLDEEHLLGSRDSLVYRLCRRLSNHCPFRYGMTGTPFGSDPTQLWSQSYLIDHGETLGKTLAIFRQAFFTHKVNHWGGVDWTFDQSKKARLHEILQHRSIRYEDHECQDLPQMSPPEHRVVTLSEEQKLYYLRATQRIKETHGDWESLKSMFIRTRQITAGFVGFKNEEDERLEIQFAQNPKIEALKELLECVPVGSKVVIYHEFLWSGRLICKALDEMKIGYVQLSGLVKGAKNKIENFHRFTKDPKVQILVANTVSGGTGVDGLQMVSRFVVFYELPVDPKSFKQAVKRVHRPGQQNRVYVYILEAAKTVDVKVWGYLEAGKNLFDAVISGRTQELLDF